LVIAADLKQFMKYQLNVTMLKDQNDTAISSGQLDKQPKPTKTNDTAIYNYT
jgi:hypothetical protein